MVGRALLVCLLVVAEIAQVRLYHFTRGTICPEGWFICETGSRNKPTNTRLDCRCIRKEEICNNETDCEDESDENYCPYDFNDDKEESCPIPRRSSPCSGSNCNCLQPQSCCGNKLTSTVDLDKSLGGIREIPLFVLRVGMKLKKLDSQTFIQAERLINQVLFEAQMGNLTYLTELVCNHFAEQAGNSKNNRIPYVPNMHDSANVNNPANINQQQPEFYKQQQAPQQYQTPQQYQMMQQNPALQQNPAIQQNLPMQQNPAMQQNPVMQQHPAIQQNLPMQQNPAMQQNSVMQQNPGLQQNSAMQQNPGLQHNPAMQQNTGLQQTPAMQQNTGLQQTPAMQQNPAQQQNSALQPNPESQQNPLLRLARQQNSAHQQYQALLQYAAPQQSQAPQLFPEQQQNQAPYQNPAVQYPEQQLSQVLHENLAQHQN